MDLNANIPLINVMDLLLDAICVVDVDGRFVFVSAACEQIFGYRQNEMIGLNVMDLVHPEDRESTAAAANQIMAGVPNPHFENRYIRRDGQVVHIMWSARWSEEDQMRVAVARDITALKHAELLQDALYAISEAAQITEDTFALYGRIHQIIGELLPARNFFVAMYDEQNDELSFPYFVDEHDSVPAPRKLESGTLSSEVILTGQALLLTAQTRAHLPDRVWPIVGSDSQDWLGVPLSTKNGVIGAVVVQSYSGDVRYTDQDKVLLQFVSTQMASAIERKQNEARLQHIAQHDPLTDLPNRELFNERLRVALAQAQKQSSRLSVLYIDLDKFKLVNDTFGHAVGDQLLRETALRIMRCVRDTDTVARLGGDEFVVLLDSIKLPRHAAAIAEKICLSLSAPYEMSGTSVYVSSSIGIAIYPEHADEKKQLLRHADDSMYSAKRSGGNRLLMKAIKSATTHFALE